MANLTIADAQCCTCKKTIPMNSCRFCGQAQCEDGNCSNTPCCDRMAVKMAEEYSYLAGVSMIDVLVKGITLESLMRLQGAWVE
jgi:hypothetical protein